VPSFISRDDTKSCTERGRGVQYGQWITRFPKAASSGSQTRHRVGVELLKKNPECTTDEINRSTSGGKHKHKREREREGEGERSLLG
jgi:hypothetical protein